jgi:hypothetical protein
MKIRSWAGMMPRGIAVGLLVCGAVGMGPGQQTAAPNAVKLTKLILSVANLDKSGRFQSPWGVRDVWTPLVAGDHPDYSRSTRSGPPIHLDGKSLV